MRLRKRVEEIESRLKVLECSHSDTKFQYNDMWMMYREKCNSCGKVLREIGTEEHSLIEKERLELELKNVTYHIKQREDAKKKRLAAAKKK